MYPDQEGYFVVTDVTTLTMIRLDKPLKVRYICNVVSSVTTDDNNKKEGEEMSVSTDLLKARKVGVRDFKSHISKNYLGKIVIVTSDGDPVSVNIPYEELLEMVDILDEITDEETSRIVEEGRRSIRSGAKGLSVSKSFKGIRAKRKK